MWGTLEDMSPDDCYRWKRSSGERALNRGDFFLGWIGGIAARCVRDEIGKRRSSFLSLFLFLSHLPVADLDVRRHLLLLVLLRHDKGGRK